MKIEQCVTVDQIREDGCHNVCSKDKLLKGSDKDDLLIVPYGCVAAERLYVACRRWRIPVLLCFVKYFMQLRHSGTVKHYGPIAAVF